MVTPDTAPNSAAKPSDVIGTLPRTPPTIEPTQRSSRVEMPPRDIRSPAKMKNGTASSAYLLRLLKIVRWIAVSGTGKKKIIKTKEVTSSSRKIGNPNISSTNGRSDMVQYMAPAHPNLPLR